ncbi:MAG: pilus assembly protein TadG-related protein [Chloroflexota bacterium]|nr:pilus assembly protein TadG-related protein [Chloroflexota bacterium]
MSAKRLLRERQGGQVLPLFALFLIALFAMAALAIDVSRAYADVRYYRASADAASLAGAQDLQVINSRSVTNADQVKARGHALESLEQHLNGNGSACSAAADIIDCPLSGSPFVVSVKTPSPSCSSCDPERSVQVTVRHPNYGLTFARVLGSTEWDLGTTSISGLVFGKSFTVITLRPPKKLGSTFDVKNITLDGGTILDVDRGDVGSNSNMNYSGTGALLVLDSGYKMYYFDPLSGPLWGPNPAGTRIPTLIRDPNYQYPSMVGAPTYDDARTSQHAALPAVERADTDPSCAAEVAKVDSTRYAFMATQAANTIYCYNPGIYDSGTGARNATITAGTGEVAILKPGAYYLKSGADISSRLIGGYDPGQPGVALMFDEAGPGNCSTCIFSGNNAQTIALNSGTKYPASFGGGTAATAAIDWAGQLVQTSGPDGPTPPILISVLVNKDAGCFVPTSAPFVEPTACDAGKDKTINIAGGGQILLEGVQYAPTDNVEISGGSSSDGRVGQIISWTLKYSGGIRINQQGPATQDNGILRIDSACSAPSEPCNP